MFGEDSDVKNQDEKSSRSTRDSRPKLSMMDLDMIAVKINARVNEDTSVAKFKELETGDKYSYKRPIARYEFLLALYFAGQRLYEDTAAVREITMSKEEVSRRIQSRNSNVSSIYREKMVHANNAFFEEYLLPFVERTKTNAILLRSMNLDPDVFRVSHLYTHGMDCFLGTHGTELRKLFNIYADRLEDNVPTKMSRRSWTALLDDSDVLTSLAINSRRYSTLKWEEIGANDEIDYARICGRNIFDQSTMFHIDALHTTDAALRFMDFVEALCRLSELLLICADKRPIALKLNDTWNEFFRPLLDIKQSPNRLMAEAIEAFVVLHVGSVSEQRTTRMAFHTAHLSDVQVRIQKARQVI